MVWPHTIPARQHTSHHSKILITPSLFDFIFNVLMLLKNYVLHLFRLHTEITMLLGINWSLGHGVQSF